jgi:hypothetical protein
MDFTPTSQKFMKYFSTYLNNVNKKDFSDSNTNTSTKIFKKLFKEIKNAEVYLNKKQQSGCFYGHIKDCNNLPTPSGYYSHFFPQQIQQSIEDNNPGYIKYKCSIHDKTITIHFITFEENYQNEKYMNLLNTYAKQMYMWIYILTLYSCKECSKTLDIYFYMTDFKKQLPDTPVQVLNENHVNTAFTNVCAYNGEMVLFRSEEWFKVFIHETFHSFGLDFSNMSNSDRDKIDNDIKTIFPLNIDVLSFEAYCEYWARTMNILFYSYFRMNQKKNLEEFIKCSIYLLQIEKVFSLYQCVKILEFMGITYEDLYKKNDCSHNLRKMVYKEDTAVFSYYVLGALLMNNYEDFMKWCDKYNLNIVDFHNTPSNLDAFFQFIKKNHRTTKFIHKINKMQTLIQNMNQSNNRIDKEIMKSMRMSIVEY